METIVQDLGISTGNTLGMLRCGHVVELLPFGTSKIKIFRKLWCMSPHGQVGERVEIVRTRVNSSRVCAYAFYGRPLTQPFDHSTKIILYSNCFSVTSALNYLLTKHFCENFWRSTTLL